MSETIDRYHIVDKLGEGGMASVFKVRDDELHRVVALKLMKPEKADSAETRKRFVKEARAMGKLTHPNIITIYDVGEHDGRPYIIMELLTGRDLEHILQEKKRFSVAEVVEYAKQLASALDCAHLSGIIHRDIKPANIFLSPDGKTTTITDFGIAFVEDLTETHHTRAGELLGTPQYMSPEQIIGRPVDARSDLFSLGAVLYELLTGQRAFDGAHFANLAYKITHEQPPAIRTIVPQVPKRLVNIIDRLIAKEPADRFQSSAELLDELESIDLENITGGVSTKQRSNAAIIGGGLILVVIAAVLAFYFKSREVTPPSVVVPTPEAKKLKEKEAEETLQAKINAKLHLFECSTLQAHVDSNNAVSVVGHVSQEDDLMKLMDMLESIPGIGNVQYEVDVMLWPFCQVASLLDGAKSRNENEHYGLTLDLNDVSIVKSGHVIPAEIIAPNYSAYVYVDWYRSDGSVVHLFPSQAEGEHLIAPNTQLTLGKNVQEQKVGPPYGDDMLVVMASRNPLIIGKRSKTEPAQNYLSVIYQQTQVVQKDVIAEYQMITTEAN